MPECSSVIYTFAMAHVIEYDELADASSFAEEDMPIKQYCFSFLLLNAKN
jgi:hypothetical protein